MENVFPRAERAEIEDIVGIRRQSAHPPIDQIPRGPITPQLIDGFQPFSVYPKWFDIKSVSEYERHIFNDKNYIEIRNEIIRLYFNSKGDLRIQDCGDLVKYSCFLNIFNFLEDNNIINYEIDLKIELDRLKKLAEDTKSLNLSDKGKFSDLKETEAPQQFACKKNKKIFSKYLDRVVLENAPCNCGSSAEFFTSDLYFICKDCVNRKNYPNTYTLRNFHKITADLLQNIWTKEEEYLLLKNIEIYGDDWKNVVTGLNKTVSQCIFHFLKMPILEACDSYPLMPFSTVPNQISTFVNYLSTMIHPVISAEVAKNAIKYLSKPNLMEILINVAVNKAKDIVDLERSKKVRLEKVETEALIRRINLKLEAVYEMYAEPGMVRVELEDGRERLVEELSKK